VIMKVSQALPFLINWHKNNEISTLRIEPLSDGYRITVAMIADAMFTKVEYRSNAPIQ